MKKAFSKFGKSRKESVYEQQVANDRKLGQYRELMPSSEEIQIQFEKVLV